MKFKRNKLRKFYPTWIAKDYKTGMIAYIYLHSNIIYHIMIYDYHTLKYSSLDDKVYILDFEIACVYAEQVIADLKANMK